LEFREFDAFDCLLNDDLSGAYLGCGSPAGYVAAQRVYGFTRNRLQLRKSVLDYLPARAPIFGLKLWLLHPAPQTDLRHATGFSCRLNRRS